MPQPKKTTSARKPAAASKKPAAPKAGKPAAKRATAAAAKPKAAPKARKPAAKPKPAAAAAIPSTTDDLTANLGALRERLVSTLTLTSDRLQETVDDAVRRGRMTRKDAEELLTQLVTAGRAQTEALLADVEQLLGRGGTSDAVLRTVDRARRKVGVGTFPILGYDELSAAQITKRLAALTPAQLRKVRDHERRHDARKSVLSAIERKLG